MKALWLLLLATIAQAQVPYLVHWQPVPEAVLYTLHNADTGDQVATMMPCDPCPAPYPMPCCVEQVDSTQTLGRASAKSVGAEGQTSVSSNTVVIGQVVSTTMPSTTITTPPPSTTTAITPPTTSTSVAPPTTVTTTSRPTTTQPPTTSTAPVPTTTSTSLPPGQTLIAAYALDETSGTSLLNATGGAPGALGTATRVVGRYGNALALDGTQQATVPAALPRTITAWVYPTGTSQTGWRCALGNADANQYQYLCVVNGTVRVGYSRTGASPWIEAAGGTAPLNTWTHVGVTFASTGALQLYVGGNLVSSNGSTSGGPLSSTATWKIGRAFTTERFTGRVDELRFYSDVRTQAQIRTDRDTPIGEAVTTSTTLPAPTTSTSTSSTSTSSTLAPVPTSTLAPVPTTSTSTSSTSTTSTSSTTSSTILCPWPLAQCPAFP